MGARTVHSTSSPAKSKSDDAFGDDIQTMNATTAYLDWNATAPIRPAARSAMLEALAQTGNPSSVHARGRMARRIVEEARAAVATLLGVDPRQVIFTSGGTEANALALSPGWFSARDPAPRDRLLVSAIEHASVLAGGRFPAEKRETVAAGPDGRVDLADLSDRLRRGGRPLVSLMAANNETGVVQPLREAASLVHEAGGLLHVDAVQAAGRISLDLGTLGVDLLTISSHKLGGPQGVGALVLQDESLHIAEPLLRGGGQERGYRAGTENVAAIAGFGAAAAEARAQAEAERAHAAALRGRLERGLKAIAPETVIFGERVERLVNTTLFALAGLKAETALIALDLEGVAVSSGAACSSGKVAPSHVLAAMGVPARLARGAIRVSTGYATTAEEIDRFLEAWRTCVRTLLKRQAEIAA